MEFEKIKIELDEKELELVNELNDIQDKISDLDAKNLSNDLMESIKTKSIETITMVLGVSDILEKRAHSNAFEASNDYKNYLKWEDTPKEKRSKSYSPKYLNEKEFNSLVNSAKDIPVYNKTERNKYLGKEFADRKNELYSKEKPFTATDGYTGKKINRFDKDLSKTSHVEHINPVYEVHKDPAFQKYLSQEERKKYVNSEENTCLTRADINISKGKTSIEKTPEWAEKNKERFDLDTEKINNKLKVASEKKKDTLQNKRIVYKAKEQTRIAGANAIKSGAKAAIGHLLTITITESIDEFKKENSEDDIKTKIKNITDRIQEKTKDLLNTFKESSISSFISTFIDALLNSVFKIFQNIIKFIKTAFWSIVKAVKILFSSDYTKEEKLAECKKILGVTVATLIGIALEEVIEKALISAFPFTAPFAGYVSPVLSGLIVGVCSVLLMQGFEKNKDSIELSKLKGDESLLLEKVSKISTVKAQVSDVEVTGSIKVTFSVFQGTLPLISSFKEQIDESLENIRETKGKITSRLEEIGKTQNENDDLLNLLESL